MSPAIRYPTWSPESPCRLSSSVPPTFRCLASVAGFVPTRICACRPSRRPPIRLAQPPEGARIHGDRGRDPRDRDRREHGDLQHAARHAAGAASLPRGRTGCRSSGSTSARWATRACRCQVRTFGTSSARLEALPRWPAIWASGTVALTGDARTRAASVGVGDDELLRRARGDEPRLGRTFRPEDSVAGAPPTILLGWDLFERRFGGDRSIVGTQILVNDEPTLVIGVMPKVVSAAPAARRERSRSAPGLAAVLARFRRRAPRGAVPPRDRTAAVRASRSIRRERRSTRSPAGCRLEDGISRAFTTVRCRRTASAKFADHSSRSSSASVCC